MRGDCATWWTSAQPLDERDAEPPPWCAEVERALAAAPPAGAPRPDAATPAESGGRRIAAAFVAAARDALRTHPHARADAVEPLAATIANGIVGFCQRAIELELEATRLIEGWPADEVAARAWELVDGLADRDRMRALLEENPCVARMAGDRLRLSVAASGRVLDHLAADLRAVDEQLVPGVADADIAAITAMGDRHDGCRQVLRITFSSGVEVMYKPRSLATDVAYDGLLAALVERGFEPAFRPLPTLAAGHDRGWQAVAVAGGCDDAAAVTRYFERLGGQLAVLYALRATDMHFENVLAAGEHPVIIDLETLLQPRLGADAADLNDPLLGECGVNSVLRVGILPRPDGPLGLDISGIGRDPDAQHAVSDDSWASWAMGPQRAREKLALGDNVARLDGVPVRPHDHVEALAAGFERAYRLLLAHRDDLLAPGGALAAFTGCGLRVILRPTQTYVFVKRQLTRKDACLADGRAQESVLQVLWRSAQERPDLMAVVPAERDDLWVGDVPRIGARPGSRDLFHPARGRLEGALGDEPCPGPDVVLRLTEDDLERQLSFLRTSVRASAVRPGPGGARPPRGRAPEPTPAGLIVHASAAAHRLARLALHDGEKASWLCLVNRCPPRTGAVLAPAGLDHADGLTGIVWFLNDLARATRDAAAGRLANAATARLWTQLGEVGLVEPEDRGGLMFALAGFAGGWRSTAADTLLADESALEGRALAAWVLGLAAAVSGGTAGGRGRARLAHDARRLALPGAAADIPAPLAACALADASGVLESDALTSAAMDILDDAGEDGARDRTLGVLAWSAVARAQNRADARTRRGLRRTLPALALEPDTDRPTADGLLDALAARAVADALDDTDLRRLGSRLLGAALADLEQGAIFDRDLETPGLRDGLAGIGATLLALSHGLRTPAESALLLSRVMPRRVEQIVPSEPTDDGFAPAVNAYAAAQTTSAARAAPPAVRSPS